ncbi:Na+/H+ antiporter NhaA [Rhodovulum sp. DZ06]|uniref:Na+/H+ antiporter NhaA n=1 Tax=Rhodovulum sp. DZ06 TaxID=3425126 RepID=UPI003D34B597
MVSRTLERFFAHEAAGGVVLALAAALAMIVSNSSLSPIYHEFLNLPVAVTVDGEGVAKSMLLWINDGLMAIFFLLVGLELKREMLEGRLRKPSAVALPGVAAIGGVLVPAAIYAAINWGNPVTISGWAIPAATDIAFALGVLALLGNRVHPSLKIFLLTLAILDDLAAILIIAAFYTAELKMTYLQSALVPLAVLAWLNWRGTHRIAPFLIVGAALWFFVLKSGVHATVAGVVTAFFIPLKDRWGKSPLHSLEHALHPWSAFAILPIFAFANAGISFTGMTFGSLMDPVPLGIAAGLFFGKQIGVFSFAWIMVKTGMARLPDGMGWLHVHGLSLLAGIGFTMSLFIGGLSFSTPELQNEVRLGVMFGSGVAGVIGALVLLMAPSAQAGRKDEAEAETAAAAE